MIGKVCPELLYCHILTIFDKHTCTHTCERSLIEIDKRENNQDILIETFFFSI